MSNSLRATGREVRGILADMSIAEVHPKTLEKPAPDTGNRMRLMHSVHLALYQAGRLANRGLERKTPKWPVRPEAISVLGYGAEKVVYRISGGEGQTDTVLSVYHRESLVSEPTIVINNKKEKHETYKRYFGDLVVPTAFLIVDNPWGEGGKPASIQDFLGNTQMLSDYSADELRNRARHDPELADNLQLLTTGYQKMLSDGIRPDFASSNLLISDSKILIFDTGAVNPTTKMDRLIEMHSNYQLIEDIAASMPPSSNQ